MIGRHPTEAGIFQAASELWCAVIYDENSAVMLRLTRWPTRDDLIEHVLRRWPAIRLF